jgi:type II secretory pathway component PulF
MANFLMRVMPKYVEIWEDRNIEMSLSQALVRKISAYSREYWFLALPLVISFSALAIIWTVYSWGSYFLEKNSKSH